MIKEVIVKIEGMLQAIIQKLGLELGFRNWR